MGMLEEIRSAIRKARANGKTLEDIAKAARLNSPQQISNFLSGRWQMRANMLERLAASLGLKLVHDQRKSAKRRPNGKVAVA